MSLYFVRHGQTNWNKAKRIQGSANISLNEVGIQQAIQTKDALKDVKMDLIYCSPLDRAIQTAEVINENWGLKIVIEPRLRERSFGIYEGENSEILDFTRLWAKSDQVFWQDSESSNEFYARVESFLDEIVELAKVKNILLVAHGGVSIPYQGYFYGYDVERLETLIIKNCEIKEIGDKDLVKWEK